MRSAAIYSAVFRNHVESGIRCRQQRRLIRPNQTAVVAIYAIHSSLYVLSHNLIADNFKRVAYRILCIVLPDYISAIGVKRINSAFLGIAVVNRTYVYTAVFINRLCKFAVYVEVLRPFISLLHFLRLEVAVYQPALSNGPAFDFHDARCRRS